MIVTFYPQGQDEKESLPADGVIVDSAAAELTFVDQEGDTAKLEFNILYDVVIEDEGGDNIDESEDTGYSSRSYSLPGV